MKEGDKNLILEEIVLFMKNLEGFLISCYIIQIGGFWSEEKKIIGDLFFCIK